VPRLRRPRHESRPRRDTAKILRDAEVAFLDALARRLGEPLPGLAAQLEMVPEPRPGTRTWVEAEATCLKAGVLVLLYPRRVRLHLLLTRRTERVLHHRGQISLPGGTRHEGEPLEATAIRETTEELGVPLDRVRVLGRLTPLYIPPSNFCIYPTVAFVPEAPASFHPQPDEVAEVIEAPLDTLLDPSAARRETWIFEGRTMLVPFYGLGEHKVWGATAMVLAELVRLLRDVAPGPKETE
jgi:8-oxo-dGTP pyrophosphatase MutT (NUDIX family)